MSSLIAISAILASALGTTCIGWATAAPSSASSSSSWAQGHSFSTTRTTTTVHTTLRHSAAPRATTFDAPMNVPSSDLGEDGDPQLALTFKPNGPQTPALQHMLLQLNAALEDKHHEKAQQLVNDYQKHHPADEGFYGNVALHYSTHHDYKEAIIYVSQGLYHYPRSRSLHILKTQILLTAGDTIKAEKEIEFCTTIAPHSEMLHAELAHLYAVHHRPGDAVKEVDKALAEDPHRISLLQTKGTMLAQMQKPAEAVAALDKAVLLTRPPADTFELRKLRAPLLEHLGHYKEAIADYQYLLKISPSLRVRALAHIGECYLALKEPHEALQYFDQELKKKPTSLRAHRGRLAAYKALGDEASASQEQITVAGLHEDWEAER